LITAVQLTGCGLTNHKLESISVSPSSADALEHGGSVQFVATGHYDGPPYTVEPLTVMWTIDNPPWGGSTQSVDVSIDSKGLARCAPGAFAGHTVLAIAPADPNAALSATGEDAVIGTADITCP
jgi:hypothetical protein